MIQIATSSARKMIFTASAFSSVSTIKSAAYYFYDLGYIICILSVTKNRIIGGGVIYFERSCSSIVWLLA